METRFEPLDCLMDGSDAAQHCVVRLVHNTIPQLVVNSYNESWAPLLWILELRTSPLRGRKRNRPHQVMFFQWLKPFIFWILWRHICSCKKINWSDINSYVNNSHLSLSLLSRLVGCFRFVSKHNELNKHMFEFDLFIPRNDFKRIFDEPNTSRTQPNTSRTQIS